MGENRTRRAFSTTSLPGRRAASGRATRVLGVAGLFPLEVTDALLDEFRRLADRHQRGFMVEHVMELLATS